MIRDLRTIIDGWDYEPGKISVRKIIGRDGQEKIQTRIDMGILQIELDGRPDGQQCRGHDSLFDYLRAQAQQHVELYGNDDDFVLAPEDCQDLRHEAYLYYQRYLSLFVLEDFARVVRDTSRNLELIDFCEKYAGADTDRDALECQRSYVMMMHARARACLALEEGRHDDALAAVESGLTEIQELLGSAELDECDSSRTEFRVLATLRETVIEKMPPDDPIKLRAELEAAIAAEDYERAAVLRDCLATQPCS